jgi:hypothetical protein
MSEAALGLNYKMARKTAESEPKIQLSERPKIK